FLSARFGERLADRFARTVLFGEGVRGACAEQVQLRQVHALAELFGEQESLVELFSGRLWVARDEEHLRRIAQGLGRPREHSEPDVLFVGIADAAISVGPLSHPGVRPGAEPTAGAETVR